MKSSGGEVSLSATDLANHIACGHLTTLNLELAHGRLPAVTNFDPLLAILAERGRAHENAYLEHLRSTGLRVESAEALPSPLDLMRGGADVICQARLSRGSWGGRADFLIRVERASKEWAWSYEVVDTKLASETRAGAVLQLCVYSDLLADLQVTAPTEMHVIKPGAGFPRDSYRVDEYAAIYRAIRRDLASSDPKSAFLDEESAAGH